MADSRSESLLVACLISCVFTCHAVLPPEAEAQLAAARAACMELGQVVDALEAQPFFVEFSNSQPLKVEQYNEQD